MVKPRSIHIFSNMAYSSSLYLMLTMLLFSCNTYVNGCYKSIISFGDSLADTGNVKQLSRTSNVEPYSLSPPYGESFFQTPTGRCSNGRLIIDFVAESLGLPFIPPSQAINNFSRLGRGVNYAVAGATALGTSFHEARGVVNMTEESLGVQLEWFKESLPSICSSVSDCKNLIGHSLILMGEIGGNDYNYALIAGKSIDEVETYPPFVIKAVISAVNELIELGANTLVIPGNLPIGCSASYLTIFYGSNEVQYDNSTGCIIQLNKLARYHNELLQTELNQIREIHPEVNIIYADYYNAAMQFFRNPYKYGFTNGALKACCGGGGPFNYNPSVACADPKSTLCDQPDTYVNWDGFHLTEAAYKVIFKSLFEGSFTSPKFNSLCPTSMLQGVEEFSSFM
uniref:GDSL esterase/lipase At1g28590-like n=1 Tax=Erigeron canadensis TaxID=72917 RepID=UPI001CB933AD|nr:GDSL esterase/lipase At1g28590-like [Erigeron canadensis]